MKLWQIRGANLPTLHIYAKSFDEALGYARMVNKNYCMGQMEEDEK